MHGRTTNTSGNCLGYTLIEALMALAIFSIGFMAVGAMQISSLGKTNISRQRTEAMTILEEEVEQLKAMKFYANENNLDDDGDGMIDETDEEFPVMAAGVHSDNSGWTGQFTVNWSVVNDVPIGKQPNIWTSGPTPITVSKIITVTISPDSRPGQELGRIEFVKTWATDPIP